jgi:hypothetical protein
MDHTTITRLDLHAAIGVALLTAAIVVIAAILLLSPAAHAATGVPACSAHVGSATVAAIAIAATGGSLIGFFTNSLLAVGGRA